MSEVVITIEEAKLALSMASSDVKGWLSNSDRWSDIGRYDLASECRFFARRSQDFAARLRAAMAESETEET